MGACGSAVFPDGLLFVSGARVFCGVPPVSLFCFRLEVHSLAFLRKNPPTAPKSFNALYLFWSQASRSKACFVRLSLGKGADSNKRAFVFALKRARGRTWAFQVCICVSIGPGRWLRLKDAPCKSASLTARSSPKKNKKATPSMYVSLRSGRGRLSSAPSVICFAGRLYPMFSGTDNDAQVCECGWPSTALMHLLRSC